MKKIESESIPYLIVAGEVDDDGDISEQAAHIVVEVATVPNRSFVVLCDYRCAAEDANHGDDNRFKNRKIRCSLSPIESGYIVQNIHADDFTKLQSGSCRYA